MRIAILLGAAIIASGLGSILVCTRWFHKVYDAYYKSRHMVSHTWMVLVV
jgi:hypothetical protein